MSTGDGANPAGNQPLRLPLPSNAGNTRCIQDLCTKCEWKHCMQGMPFNVANSTGGWTVTVTRRP